MRLNLFPLCAVVGVHLTPTGLQLVQLKKIKQQYLVEYCHTEDVLSNGASFDKVAHWQSLKSLLARLVMQLQLQRQPAVTHLPNHLVKLGKLWLPEGFTAVEIENEIYAQLPEWTVSRHHTIIKYKPWAIVNGYQQYQYVCADKQDITQYFNIM